MQTRIEDRRSFGVAALRLLLGASLLQHAAAATALTGSVKWSARPWLQRLDEASSAVAAGSVRPTQWQDEVTAVLGGIDLPDLLRSLDFDALARGASFPLQGEGMQRLYFPDADGKLQPLRFRPYLFTLRRDTAVVPHGHHNMTTMHMVLAGRARVRHFDRLADSDTHMLLRPASDVEAGPGVVTTISDDRHNVHWMQSLSDQVFMFNIGVYQLKPDQPFGERDYVDPLAGVTVADGSLRAPRLERAAAYAKYGRG